jgi:HAD superfamily hydrolase (TIGR01509 family)
MIRGVLLDVDGTLLDSNDAHAEAFVQALAENGYSVPFTRIRRLIGMGGDKLLQEAAGLEEDDPAARRITGRHGEIFKEQYLPHLKPFPRVRELLTRMRESGLKLVAASSAKKEELGALLQAAGAEDLLDGQTSSTDVENSKPDPDIVRAALEKVGCPAAQVVMVGDTPYDVEAALRAGVAAIAVRCGGWRDEDLAGAVAIYDDPADLLARYDESPLGGSHR